MPNLDAANIAFNLLKITGGDGVTVGPILLGTMKARADRDTVGHRAAAGQPDGAGGGGCGGGGRLTGRLPFPREVVMRRFHPRRFGVAST